MVARGLRHPGRALETAAKRANQHIEVWGPQLDFISAPERFTAFIAGIGSGKTYAGSIRSLMASATPGSLGLVVAPTYPMLRDATARTLLEVLEPYTDNYHKSDGIITLLNGSEILLRSADKPDRLRGPNLHWAWIDEAALTHESTFDIIIGRLRADGTAGPLWLTGTPKGFNWVWKKKHLYRIFQARTDQNPYLHPEYVAALKESYSSTFAAQEIAGQFVKFEGLIYDEFDYNRHVMERSRDQFTEFIGGADEGYINPQVFITLGVTEEGGVHVFSEFYERKIRTAPAAQAAAELDREYRIDTWYLDPSAPGLRAEMEIHGMNVAAANNAVLEGIQLVKKLLNTETAGGYPALTIDPSCVWLISELEQYAWKEKKDGSTAKEEPVKENDHALDALRYATYSHLGTGLRGQLMY